MCGICGLAWRDPALLRKMNARIEHRGPDGQGVMVDQEVSLGHRRLAIIDLSPKGRQPLTYKRLTITFNGEIYNYAELKDELVRRGHRFTTDTDTEVILASYDEWGRACLNKLNGMFAFCIYDRERKELFLARDRFGIKPLYYVLRREGLAFSSEIGGLLGLVVAPAIDREGLSQFFTFRFTLGETTMLKGVKKLLPGHSLVYDLRTRKVRTREEYYRLRPKEAVRSNTADKHHGQGLRRQLDAAVGRWMVADVPVGSFLSGGIDSSAITLLATKRNRRMNTFSMGFETTNELPYARLVAEALGTKHHELRLDETTILTHMDGMIAHMDEPIGDPGFLPVYVLSQEVARHNKVVLSGDGGDEVLAGYDRYKLLHYGRVLRHAAISDFGSDILRRLKAMRHKDEYGMFLEVVRLFEQEELRRLGVPEYDARPLWDRATAGFPTAVERAQAFDLATLLPGDFFMKADKMSSAWGLEQRTPFLDHELVEYAFSLPLGRKLRYWNEKAVLKAAFRDDLPAAVVKRRKQGFNVPIDHWFKGALGNELRRLLDQSRHGLYDKGYAYELLERIKRKGSNYKENFVLAQKLWSVYVFEKWHREVFKHA